MKRKNCKIGTRVQLKENGLPHTWLVHNFYSNPYQLQGQYGTINALGYNDYYTVIIDGNNKVYILHRKDLRLASKQEPEKPWPDTFEEAKELSNFWGFLWDGCRTMIVMNGTSDGSAVRPHYTFADKDAMERYWNKTEGGTYKFIKFDTAKELYQWLLDGEE